MPDKLPLGVNIGYYAAKFSHANSLQNFPSIAARPGDSMFSLGGADTIIRFGSHRFSVGVNAARAAGSVRLVGDSWYGSPEYMALLYAGISRYPFKERDVMIVTGLPIADQKRCKAALQRAIQGRHTFAKGERGKDLDLHIARVAVVPEAWGAVLCDAIGPDGSERNPELLEQDYGVIDVGSLTVNYLALSGLSDDPAGSFSTARGAWIVADQLRKWLEENYPGLNRHNDHRIMAAIVAREIYNGAQRIDLAPIIGNLIDDIGNEIVRTSQARWGEGAPTMRRIYVCGGGAYLWGDRIQAAYSQAVIVQNPEYANAIGFYRLALNKVTHGKW